MEPNQGTFKDVRTPQPAETQPSRARDPRKAHTSSISAGGLLSALALHKSGKRYDDSLAGRPGLKPRRRVSSILAIVAIILVGTGMVASPPPPSTKTLIIKTAKGLTDNQGQAIANRHNGTWKRSVPKLDLHIIEVPANAAEGIKNSLKGDAAVLRVEESLQRRFQSTPSDALYAQQWALPKIGWDQVYGSVTPQFVTEVAVLDTGVDASHPDLIGSIGPSVSMLAGADPLSDANGHGTWLAGIVAAKTDNVQGVAGVAYDHVQVMPVKVLGDDGYGQDSDIIAGVMWAADNGASVILMGFSNPGSSQALQDAVDYAWSKGVVLVAAAGNDAANTPTFPAGTMGVIGVSATDQK